MAGISQTVIRNLESTQNVSSSRSIRDVADRIAYLDPDSSPLTVILMRGSTRPAMNWKFEWIEKELPARWDAVNAGGGYTAGDTTITVDNAKFFSAGDVVNVPAYGEKFEVATVSTTNNTLTIVRGVGSTAAHAFVDNDDLQIIGNSYAEGAISGTPKSVTENFLFNYTQIVRTPFGVTRTEMNTENYGGPDRVRLRREKGVEHKIDLERTCLFGERNLNTSGNDSTDNPRRYTGGLLYFLNPPSGSTAKIKDFGGQLTEPEMEDWMQDVFTATAASDTRTLVASPLWVTVLDQIAAGRMETVPKTETYGVTVRQWITAHGTFNIIKHRLLENNPVPGSASTAAGYTGYALALDLSRVSMRPLQNSNTQLKTDIQAPDYDGAKDEYLTETGWEVNLAKVHGIGKGVTG